MPLGARRSNKPSDRPVCMPRGQAPPSLCPWTPGLQSLQSLPPTAPADRPWSNGPGAQCRFASMHMHMRMLHAHALAHAHATCACTCTCTCAAARTCTHLCQVRLQYMVAAHGMGIVSVQCLTPTGCACEEQRIDAHIAANGSAAMQTSGPLTAVSTATHQFGLRGASGECMLVARVLEASSSGGHAFKIRQLTVTAYGGGGGGLGGGAQGDLWTAARGSRASSRARSASSRARSASSRASSRASAAATGRRAKLGGKLHGVTRQQLAMIKGSY